MSRFKIDKSSYILILIFILASAVIFFLLALMYKHFDKLSDNTSRMMNSQEISLYLERVHSRIKDVEVERRNFILIEDESSKVKIESDRKEIKTLIDTLKILTSEDKIQKNNLKNLVYLLDQKYKIVDSSLGKEHRTYSKEILKETLVEGESIVKEVDSKIKNMIQQEHKNLLRTKIDLFFSERSTPLYIYLISLVSLVILFFTFYRLYKDSLKQKKYNERLEMALNTTSLSETVGNYGIWTYNLATNTFAYSDNEYKIFGYDPNDPDLRKINLVSEEELYHPEDREFVRHQNDLLKQGVDMSTFTFRVIRKDGEIRNFKTNRKKFLNSSGQEFILGITTDITEEVLAKNKIEETYRNLELQNKELMAFNYVASHDLQEPLRKIETFLSRLHSSDYETLTDSGKEYLTRTVNSASRMRLLINDLLQFSRTTRSDKDFETTDLNSIFELSLDNFHQQITNKNAKIECDTLPILKMIPFQAQQLFNNIIGNSFKYSKTDLPLEIKITCKKIKSKDLPTEISGEPIAQNYYLITFTDNGIGFDNQYSNQIFELFNRLHGKMDYVGTGIGLAICKKIVDNHAGYIKAYGEENVGATFSIYLPQI